MENAIFVGLSKSVGLKREMDVVANNIANLNTPGYRQQNMVFNEYLADPRGAERPLSQVLDYGQYQDTRPGSIDHTGNPLDVALSGSGYLGVEGPGDAPTYTRAGRFNINANGEIVTPAGFPVLDEGGNPIILPQNAAGISIDETGVISTEDGEVAQLKVVEFANEQDLAQIGNNLYTTEQEEIPSPTTTVIQGAYEQSNVQAVLEMTRMIEVSRSYQSVQRMIEQEHSRQKDMIEKLSRTS